MANNEFKDLNKNFVKDSEHVFNDQEKFNNTNIESKVESKEFQKSEKTNQKSEEEIHQKSEESQKSEEETHNKSEKDIHHESEEEIQKFEEEVHKASKFLFESCELNDLFIEDLSDDEFILNLFKYFIKIYNEHYEPVYIVNLLRQYFKDNNKKSFEIFNQLIHHRKQIYFTSMIGYFYQFGIAKISLAYLYFYGFGVKEDMEKAFILYNEAAENNYGLGQYFVGKCFEEGYGIEKNINEAFDWW
ncbi:kinase-like protein [Gigaspora margarita]|uniref:Kinase-like protein n=1 Tax=Gigaspora margarita TaxID=4874 RepID=A0A8H4EG01_GIGMA|nr:kinase-like protein [Gigaspora margarita]